MTTQLLRSPMPWSRCRWLRAARLGLLVFGSFIALPASAGAWSRPFQVSPTGYGHVNGAELDNEGVLRVWWESKAEAENARGVSLTTHTGQTKTAKVSAMDSFINDPIGINPQYEEPMFLHDGRAIRCAITLNHARTQAHVFMLVYSHSGALIKRVLIASQSQDASELEVAPNCQVAAAGERAVIEFTQQTESTNRYQGNRQIYVVMVLPKLQTTAPMPMLASGEAQQTFIPSYLTEQISMASSGWSVLTWAQDSITKNATKYIDQRWQFLMRWLSPDGVAGPVIALGQPKEGRQCFPPKSRCPGFPPVPAVEAVGTERALVVFGSPHLMSEEVSGTGQVTKANVVSEEEAFTAPESKQVAFGGHAGVVAWGGGYSHNRCQPIRVVQWHEGRWSKPIVPVSPAPKECVYGPSVHVNEHGQASVIWWRELSLYIGYWQAAFDF
jgi:hypothetical protein